MFLIFFFWLKFFKIFIKEILKIIFFSFVPFSLQTLCWWFCSWWPPEEAWSFKAKITKWGVSSRLSWLCSEYDSCGQLKIILCHFQWGWHQRDFILQSVLPSSSVQNKGRDGSCSPLYKWSSSLSGWWDDQKPWCIFPRQSVRSSVWQVLDFIFKRRKLYRTLLLYFSLLNFIKLGIN